MKSRKDIQTYINELNAIALPKKMFLTLIPEDLDKAGIDAGLLQVVISTKLTLRQPSSIPTTGELMAMILAKQNDTELPKIKPTSTDDDADQLEKDLYEIDGVKKVMFQKYELLIEKPLMFDWEEILPKVLETLERFGLMKEFKLKGGVSGNIPGVSEVN